MAVKSYYEKLDVCVCICLIVSPSAMSPSTIFHLSVCLLLVKDGHTEIGLTPYVVLHEIVTDRQTEMGLTSHSNVFIKESSKKCQKAFLMVKIDPYF